MLNLTKKIINWLTISKAIHLPYKHAWLITSIVIKTKWESLKNSKISYLISSIIGGQRKALSRLEYYLLWASVESTENVPGDIAEVGVYKGSSAKIICETTTKQVHLFDTFEGLPEVGARDNADQFKKGEYSASYDDVGNYLKEYPNAHFYKGLFPNTATPVIDKRFSLVHLDVDIYESTLKCLEFFYSRMSVGGVIISHDYTSAIGVKKAFDDFLKNKPELLIILLARSTQCCIIKK